MGELMTNKIESADLEYRELLDIIHLINDMYDFDLSGYSKESITRRFNRLLDKFGWNNAYDLKFGIINRKISLSTLINELTVNVTEMFRDPEFYVSIQKHTLPYLKTFPSFKIWHAGCSTGEETYSFAITLQEHGLLNRSIQYSTDINSEVIDKARTGIYTNKNMKVNSTNYLYSGGKSSLSDYYISKYGNVKMNKDLKKNMVFSRHNLINGSSFNEFQLIVCRNVLIYFDIELKNKVIKLFYESLAPFGYLALGSMESLIATEWSNQFEIVDRKNKIYRKKGYKGER